MVRKTLNLDRLTLIPMLDRYFLQTLIMMEIWMLLPLLQVQIKLSGMKMMVLQTQVLQPIQSLAALMALCPFMPRIWITMEISIF